MRDKISEVMAVATVETQEQLKQLRSTKSQRAVRIAGIFAIVLTLTMSFAFADKAIDSVEGGIKTGTEKLYNIMTAVVLPIAAVFFAWNAFKALFGGERGMETAKKNMLITVAVLALVFLAPLIIKEISGWFSESSDFKDVLGSTTGG